MRTTPTELDEDPGNSYRINSEIPRNAGAAGQRRRGVSVFLFLTTLMLFPAAAVAGD